MEDFMKKVAISSNVEKWSGVVAETWVYIDPSNSSAEIQSVAGFQMQRQSEDGLI